MKSEKKACEWLKARGFTEILHNIEICGVQVDILARSSDDCLTLIEVKSQTAREFAHLAWRQRARLGRVATVLAEYEPVDLWLVLVNGGVVETLPIWDT